MSCISINHCDAAPIHFDLSDPEVQELAAEMRVHRYLRDGKHFIDIAISEASDEH